MNTARLRVLHLEDNVYDFELVEAMLAGEGFDATMRRVQSRDEFLEALDTGGFDVILADYSLPAYDGSSALVAAKELQPDIPFLFVSGAMGEERAVETLKKGATDYVLKTNLARLAPCIRRALDEVEEKRKRQEAEAQLRRLNAELEQRVLERTLELTEKNRLLEEEVRIARELQIAMLPQRFPSIPAGASPENSVLRFLTFYRPAGTVSGDFFDVLQVSDMSVGLLLCDVMGHDVRAALVTGMLRAMAGQIAPMASSPREVLMHMNRGLSTILRKAGTTLFATAFYLVVDVASGELVFSNAGHPYPVRVQRQRGEIELMDGKRGLGPALGLWPETEYSDVRRPMERGDFLMLFTDGLLDIEDPYTHESFSQQRLIDAARHRIDSPPEELFYGLLDDIHDFARGTKFEDDACLLRVALNSVGT